MQPTSLRHNRSLRDAMQYMAVILAIGGGIGLLVSLVCQLVCQGSSMACAKPKRHNRRAFAFARDRIVIDANALVDSGSVAIGDCPAASFDIDRWHGPADSIYAAHRTDNELDLRAGIGSTLAAFISLGGGAPVGQYGPLVHFGAAIGSYLSELFGSRRITADVFIGCGVAAAIAAGFHAPIAGVVFAHEAVLRHFSFRAITPIAIASITSAWFSSAMFGGQPIFQIDVVLPDLLPLVPTLLASGLFFGLIAILFMKLLFAGGKIGCRTGLSPLPLGLLAAVFVAR